MLFLSLDGRAAANHPIPTVDSHKEFLLNVWNPNLPTVVVFKDPFCPYCIKAFQRPAELEGFNVFLFWYPIFGEKSNSRVDEFFKCKSPVEPKVVAAVLGKRSPDCKAPINISLKKLNTEMYEGYSPSGVPAYYFGGNKISVAELKAVGTHITEKSSGVSLDWKRYEKNRLGMEAPDSPNVGIFYPSGKFRKNLGKLIKSLKKTSGYNWYFFSPSFDSDLKSICKSHLRKCDSSFHQDFELGSREMQLLFGIEDSGNPVVIMNGRILSSDEIRSKFAGLAPYIL
jgi:hypothetical protein